MFKFLIVSALVAAALSATLCVAEEAVPIVTVSEEDEESSWFGQIWLGLVIGVLAVMWVHMNMKSKQVVEDLPAAQVFVPRPFTAAELIKYRGQGKPKSDSGMPNEFEETQKLMASKPIKKGKGEEPELAEDESDLIFIGVKGVIYNVSPQWYGPGSPYNVFAGREASRHLGKIIVGSDEANADWTTLSPEHITSLGEWEDRFKSKYTPVGWFVPDADYYERAKQFTP